MSFKKMLALLMSVLSIAPVFYRFQAAERS